MARFKSMRSRRTRAVRPKMLYGIRPSPEGYGTRDWYYRGPVDGIHGVFKYTVAVLSRKGIVECFPGSNYCRWDLDLLRCLNNPGPGVSKSGLSDANMTGITVDLSESGGRTGSLCLNAGLYATLAFAQVK